MSERLEGALREFFSKINGLDLFIFYMRYEKGMTLSDIKERIGMSYEGIRKRLLKMTNSISRKCKHDSSWN